MKMLVRSAVMIAAVAGSAAAQPMTMPGMAGGSSAADQEFAAGMTKMNNGMAGAPMTGNTDQDFVAMMIPHHQGAVDMAKTELKYGKDPELLALSREIIAAQDKEIAQMKRWQALHKPKS
ncbi:MAG: hypothetical protein B7Z75_05975 [Acidocella sp. 20-57-95]|nr:MAG: hypothetical protein B7Z75_05975 [Acidocella sp. 20-57-95]OYV58515.1 MAG: hypothetical protein B7Z71_10055 [Acidocella sp. 21-58-7]